MEVSSWPPRWLTPVPEKAIEAGRREEPIADFAEAFGIITKDSVAGKSGEMLKLRPWQVSLFEHLFAYEDGGYRHQSQLVGMPRNMDGSFGPSAEMVHAFVGRLKESFDCPVRTWDERLTSTQANRLLVQGNVRRKERKQKVDQTAAAILLQSYLDSLPGVSW